MTQVAVGRTPWVGDLLAFLCDANNRLVMAPKPFSSFQLSLCDCLCESLIVVVTKMASLRGRTLGVVAGSATPRDDGGGDRGSPLAPWAHPPPSPPRAVPCQAGHQRARQVAASRLPVGLGPAGGARLSPTEASHFLSVLPFLSPSLPTWHLPLLSSSPAPSFVSISKPAW